MVKLASALSRLNAAKVMIVGDLLLDMYTVGKARRISPEAPVAIVNVQKEEYRPGGAGNVALNLISLGAQVVPIARIGNDWAGNLLKEAFQSEGMDTDSIFIQEHFQTPIKNRIIVENQQIVRVDYENVTPLSEQLEQKIIDALPALMQNIAIIAISDYGKGFLTTTLLSAIIGHAKRLKIPVVADPKGNDFGKYSGTTVIKPNLSEAFAAANLSPEAPLEQVAKRILEIADAEMLMITRSEAGISLFESNGERHDFPVHIKQVKDVTGAGDTVLAMLTYALANKLSYTEAAQLCNIAAGIAIERIGCARVGLADLASRLFERDVSHKIFDEDHLFVLQEVLRPLSFNLLAISNTVEFSHQLFSAIKQLSQNNTRLLVYVIEPESGENFIEILSSLKEVHFIVLHKDNFRRLFSVIRPIESYLFNTSGLESVMHIEQIFETGSV